MAVNALNGFAINNGDWVNGSVNEPLSILVVNLMPNKETTELQYLNLLYTTGRDCEVTFCYPRTHHFRNTDVDDIKNCYFSFPEVARNYFDGLIITGAPVETLPYQAVDYWSEFQLILSWADTHVNETLLECWAALAGLHNDYQIDKRKVACKLFGIYTADFVNTNATLGRGFDQIPLRIPQSRHSTLNLSQPVPKGLKTIATSYELGPLVLQSQSKHRTYITGHPEYFDRTLSDEYFRDLRQGKAIQAPRHYFTDDSHRTVNFSWHNASRQLYVNWLTILDQARVNDATPIAI